MPPTLMGSLPPLVDPVLEAPSHHTQRCLSQVILNLNGLTIQTNHRTHLPHLPHKVGGRWSEITMSLKGAGLTLRLKRQP